MLSLGLSPRAVRPLLAPPGSDSSAESRHGLVALTPGRCPGPDGTAGPATCATCCHHTCVRVTLWPPPASSPGAGRRLICLPFVSTPGVGWDVGSSPGFDRSETVAGARGPVRAARGSGTRSPRPRRAYGLGGEREARVNTQRQLALPREKHVGGTQVSTTFFFAGKVGLEPEGDVVWEVSAHLAFVWGSARFGIRLDIL